MIDLSKNQRSINTSGAHVDGGDVGPRRGEGAEALRARFEKLLSDSGRACLYEGDGQYAYPHDFSWLCYQAGYAAAKAETAAAGEPVAWAHFAENGNIRLWAPERPLDLDGNAAHPLYTAEQLTAAADPEREKCAGIVNELRMECARRNMPESATMLWHAEDAIRAGAKETSDADKT